MLESSQYPSITQLAEAEKVDRAGVSRTLMLTLLAPDIVDAILDGRQPEGITISELKKAVSGGVGKAAGKVGSLTHHPSSHLKVTPTQTPSPATPPSPPGYRMRARRRKNRGLVILRNGRRMFEKRI
ncbi:MAG: hypothetical protein HQL52_19145 [Magnetococcales bacterium]|nr:hypothetical protein [Magnetococcales bacterium]